MDVSIIANGTVKSGVWLKRRLAGTVIAADGGANICKRYGITPKYVIGDFDSAKKSTLAFFKRSTTIVHAPDQGATDFQKALHLAGTLKARRILVFGAIGSELDHTMANVLTLTPQCVMLDESHEIRVVEKRLALSGRSGDIVSMIALTDVRGLTYRGLKWPVSGLSVPAGWIGIRNRLVGRTGSVSVTSGKIAVITYTA